jgi:hypothetical protein
MTAGCHKQLNPFDSASNSTGGNGFQQHWVHGSTAAAAVRLPSPVCCPNVLYVERHPQAASVQAHLQSLPLLTSGCTFNSERPPNTANTRSPTPQNTNAHHLYGWKPSQATPKRVWKTRYKTSQNDVYSTKWLNQSAQGTDIPCSQLPSIRLVTLTEDGWCALPVVSPHVTGAHKPKPTADVPSPTHTMQPAAKPHSTPGYARYPVLQSPPPPDGAQILAGACRSYNPPPHSRRQASAQAKACRSYNPNRTIAIKPQHKQRPQVVPAAAAAAAAADAAAATTSATAALG